MNRLIEFIKTSAVYFLGTVINKFMVIILLPLYTQKITPEDYGYYDLTVNYITLIISIVFIEFWTVIMRELLELNEKSEKNKIVTNGVVIFLGCLTVYTILISLIQQFVSIDNILWVYIYGVSIAIQNLYSALIRGFELNKLYVFSGMVNTCITLILNIIFLEAFSGNYISLYAASIIGILLQVFIMEYKAKITKNIMFKHFDFGLIKKILKISLPLGVNSISYWILFNYNRILIVLTLGAYENGLYVVSTKFSSILRLLTTCIALSWQEIAFKNKNINKNFFCKASNLYIKALSIGILISIPFINIVFPIIIGKNYYGAKNIIPLSILASTMSIFSGFLTTIFAYIRDYKSVMISTTIGGIVNVLVVNLLISKVGVNASSIAMFLGAFANVVVRLYILNKKINLKIDFKYLIKFIPFVGLVVYIYINCGVAINILTMSILLLIVTWNLRGEILRLYKAFRDKSKSIIK